MYDYVTDAHIQDGLLRLGEIITGYALGLEISTMSSVCSGHFATAHEKLGRNRPTHGLKNEHLTNSFFSKILKNEGELIQTTAFPVCEIVLHVCM